MTPQNSSVLSAPPPDQAQRDAALDPHRSLLVQAPAGSGKTDLLTRRFLRLLAEVDDPGQIVAITFTRPAAAEMRHRILNELAKAAERSATRAVAEDSSMESLAARALAHSQARGWRLLDLSSQLRISTIDSFCRDLALQQPIFSGIGNNLEISDSPADLYRRAARLSLLRLGDPQFPELSDAIKDLLLWRDNSWKDLEDLLVKMLGQRDRWMLDFVLSRQQDWDSLRERLERPFANAVRAAIEQLEQLICEVPGACDEAHELAQFASVHAKNNRHGELAELAEFPHGPYEDSAALEGARSAYVGVAQLLLNNEGEFRERFDKTLGFPRECLDEKFRIQQLVVQLRAVPDLQEALVGIRALPPARYSEEDWNIIRACFLLLRHAAGELRAVFAEAGTVDFIEVAQTARNVLRGEDNLPSDAAQTVADDIRHLLVDEFQDTSRRQHEFITALIEAWPDPTGRTIFVVGDPMQSIYFFRDAEAELFRRVKERGFERSDGEAFPLRSVALTSNFRTAKNLVSETNNAFERVFAEPDGSGISFAPAEPARNESADSEKRLHLHLEFVAKAERGNSLDPDSHEAARTAQIAEIVAIIHEHLDRIEAARLAGRKYRIAVLGRARTALAPIASALRDAGIPFRAVELETLKDRPEILDAVALCRALLNREDRAAWLGVLRAPWCGLSLADLHAIAGADGGSQSPVPQLLAERKHLLSADSRNAAQRVLDAFASIPHLRSRIPTTSTGTLVQQLWRTLGGERCVDASARANLDLFWALLDELREGEQDLLGSALDSALAELCALPDPATSSECGVQLMTIHKSKGLEFEVVIVPDLQARSGQTKSDLLSWLERGIAEPDDSGAISEFLIAPLQNKGADPGKSRSWVERIRRDRERQEMRRLLYVAATRAREELHLFARPTYKTNRQDVLELLEPTNCLLATAWAALADEIRARFDAWQEAPQNSDQMHELILPSLAAAEQSKVAVIPKPTILRRLPPNFELKSGIIPISNPTESVLGLGDAYQRHEGGLHARALGNAVHQLLEDLARLRTMLDWEEARAEIGKLRPRIAAHARSAGISSAQSESIAAKAVEIAQNASRDVYGQWILSPRDKSVSESGWAGIVAGNLRTVRVDRLFRAGREPLQPGNEALWIIDYKTAHAEIANAEAALREFRLTFAPQLQMYAAVLRNLHGADTQLRAGLYYPRMSAFDWWEL